MIRSLVFSLVKSLKFSTVLLDVSGRAESVGRRSLLLLLAVVLLLLICLLLQLLVRLLLLLLPRLLLNLLLVWLLIDLVTVVLLPWRLLVIISLHFGFDFIGLLLFDKRFVMTHLLGLFMNLLARLTEDTHTANDACE